jgi:hypothetical protein
VFADALHYECRMRRFVKTVILAVVLLGGSDAIAKLNGKFLLDVAPGVTIPVGDSDYNRFVDPTFKFSLRLGGEIWFSPQFGIAPEFTLDLIPIKTDDHTYRPFNGAGADTPFGRVRGLLGSRLLLGFPPYGAFFFRLALGVDYITGSEQASVGPFSASISFSSTAFTVEPGVGVQFKITRYGVVGLMIDFPVAVQHDFGKTDAGGIRKFTAVDIDLLFFIGARI